MESKEFKALKEQLLSCRRNGGAYPTFDKDHDEKGRPTYYKK